MANNTEAPEINNIGGQEVVDNIEEEEVVENHDFPVDILDSKNVEAKLGKKIINTYLRRNPEQRAKYVNFEMVFEDTVSRSPKISSREIKCLMARIEKGWIHSNIFWARKVVIKLKVLEAVDQYCRKNVSQNIENGGKKMRVDFKVQDDLRF